MNTKVILGVLLVIIVVGGGIFLVNRKNNPTPQQAQDQMHMNKPEPSKTAMPSSNGSSSQIVETTSVNIANFAYDPPTIKIKVGDTVTWTNKDNVGHSATADDGTWDTGVLQQGKSGSAKFSKAGVFTYHCSVHPNMHGTIVVQAK